LLQQMLRPTGSPVVDRSIVARILPLVRDRVRPIIAYVNRVAARRKLKRRGMLKQVERKLHVVGGNRHAVMPADSVAQVNGPGTEIGRMLPRFREPPLQLSAAIPSSQWHEDEEFGGHIFVWS